MAKYIKHDSELGFVEDNAEIEYLKFNNMRHTVLGCMLGDFDDQGRYFLSPAIKNELLLMPKYLVDTIENIEICNSFIKLDKQISFMITYEGNRVTLSLVEKINFQGNIKINSGIYANINEYLLDEVEVNGPVNKNILYQKWNIKEYGGTALDVFNMDEATLAGYFNIVNRFKYLMEANKILLQKEEQIEEIESLYANRILDILKHYPKLKQAVENDIKEVVEGKKDFIRLDKPNFAKTLNEIIEQSIEQHIELLNEKEQQEFKTEKHIVQNEINILRQDVVPTKTTAIALEQDGVIDYVSAPKSTTIDTKNEEKSKTIVEVATEFVKQEKSTEEKVADRAVEDVTGEKPKKEDTTDKKPVLTEEDKKTAQSLRDKNEKEIVRVVPVEESEKAKLIAVLGTFTKPEKNVKPEVEEQITQIKKKQAESKTTDKKAEEKKQPTAAPAPAKKAAAPAKAQSKPAAKKDDKKKPAAKKDDKKKPAPNKPEKAKEENKHDKKIEDKKPTIKIPLLGRTRIIQQQTAKDPEPKQQPEAQTEEAFERRPKGRALVREMTTEDLRKSDKKVAIGKIIEKERTIVTTPSNEDSVSEQRSEAEAVVTENNATAERPEVGEIYTI